MAPSDHALKHKDQKSTHEKSMNLNGVLLWKRSGGLKPICRSTLFSDATRRGHRHHGSILMASPSTTRTSSPESDLAALRDQISLPALESLGSYNLVYRLTFDDGHKWAARIPDPETFDAPSMQSAIITLRLIRQKTSVPFPTIHAFDTSSNNELGMPFVLMDFVEGVPLITIWKDETIMDDAARRHIFEQVAGYMSQLRALEFDKIGHLQFDEASGIYSVRPLRMMNHAPGMEGMITESGPFTSTHAFLSHRVQELIDSPQQYTPTFCAMRLLALALTDPKYDDAPFVLSHPDFDAQNVLVDPKTFTVTGFIDWDGVSVSPRLGGFARYPSWITRDWDPSLYDWRDPEAEDEGGTSDEEVGAEESHSGMPDSSPADASSFINHEESPETLQRHRDLYLSIYSAIDTENADVTRQSHIFEALDIALYSPPLALNILVKLCKYVFDADAALQGEIVSGLEAGDWMKDLKAKHAAPSA